MSIAFLGFSILILATAATAQSQSRTGVLTVTGTVMVNGRPAATGDIVSSGSAVETTGQNSSAVVSLGKLGRVEVLPNTQIQLTYDDRSITIMLNAGSVRVSTRGNVAATVTRR